MYSQKQCIWFNSVHFLSRFSRAVSALPLSETCTSCSICPALEKIHTSPFFCRPSIISSTICSHTALLHRIVLSPFQASCYHQFKQMFLLWVTAALSKYEHKQKLYLWRPEGTRELPPIPEVRESRGMKCITGRRALTCPGPLTPVQHTLDFRTGDDTHQDPGLVLIKPPSGKPSKINLLASSLRMEWLSQPAAISTTRYFALRGLTLFFMFFSLR